MNSKAIILLTLQLLFVTCSFAQILTSSNLPIVVINTNDEDIPDEPKIDATMGIIFNGDGAVNNLSDPYNHYDGSIGIETRGNSTQGFDKKTYSIELRDAQNNDLTANLFGMGGEEDWILHAMVIDKSQVRIPMSFYFAQQMGHYASEWKYVELVLNGEYRGLYILTEKIKRDDDRVDIAKLDENDVVGDSLTGGYILRIDWLWDFDSSSGFESNYESQAEIPMTFQWYYPKAEVIQPEQAEYIQNWMALFEEALYSPDYMNSDGVRYSDYINLNSFTDFLLINELSKNSDGYKLSSYVHKDREDNNGKLTAGPIWDFDQTYGVSLVCSNNDFTGWTYLQNQDGCEDLESMPLWWQTMMADDVFKNRLKCRWTSFRNSFLHADSVNAWIDADVNFISDAIDRNFTKWDDFIGESIWIEPEPIPQTYEEEIQVLKDWIMNRLVWMDDNLPGNCEDDISAIDSGQLETLVEVYPNPSSANYTINVQNTEPLQYLVYSAIGDEVMTGFVDSNHKTIRLAQLPNGLYYLKVGNQTIRIVKAE